MNSKFPWPPLPRSSRRPAPDGLEAGGRRRRLLSWRSGLILVAALGIASGCSDFAAFEAGQALDEATASGQTLVVVGTDPSAMSTDIYLVRALGIGATTAPSIAQADSFEVEAITQADPTDPSPIVTSDTESLFSERVPFPIPDHSGNRLAFVVSTDAQDGDVPTARPAVVTLSPRSRVQGPDVPGLFGARFTWQGDFLVLQFTDPDTQRDRLLATTPELLEEPGTWIDLGPADPTLDIRFQGLVAESNVILALATDTETGWSSVYRLNPETGEHVVLTEQVESTVVDAVLSADGQVLAVTTQRQQPETRDIELVDVETGKVQSITGGLGSDCYWPAFATAENTNGLTRLAFVCQYPDSGRPDIVLWSGSLDDLDLATEAAPAPEILTAAPQPSVFNGTMDGLVVRSPPQWDPRGELIVFGASTQEEAFDGDGMTLFALPPDETAYPIYSSSDTSVDWAHFSKNSDAGNLLVWERSETGLEDTRNAPGEYRQPIRVVSTDTTPPQISYVELGVNIRVGYPLFLGQNSLFYP